MRSLVAALVTVVLWASAFVGIRAAGEELSPGALALGRLLVGSAALGAIVLIRREPLPSRGYLSWHGDKAARAAVYGNRKRLRSGVGKDAMRKRG